MLIQPMGCFSCLGNNRMSKELQKQMNIINTGSFVVRALIRCYFMWQTARETVSSDRERLIGFLQQAFPSASCPICIEPVEPFEMRRLLSCGHESHWRCCQTWLKSQPVWPYNTHKLTDTKMHTRIHTCICVLVKYFCIQMFILLYSR